MRRLCSAIITTLILMLPMPSQAQAPTVGWVNLSGNFGSSTIGLASAGDGSDRLFTVRQSGQILIHDGVQVLATPFLDLSSIISSGGEQGLLGLAFHPDYASNGFFFVNYSDLAGDTVVARYTVSAGDANVANPASAQIVLTFNQPAQNHNGGDLHFGPDGLLYISSGDGGFSNSNGQLNTTLLGKLLRIDIDSDDFPADSDRNYAIPPANPFVGVPGAAEEIFQMGLRNPWRFSFDRTTGDLFIGDVGDGAWEEIDYAPSPTGTENWGWPCYEGDVAFNTSGCDDIGQYDFPILTLGHGSFPDNNCSVIGGYRYRGSAYPALVGWYFYSDWCTGTLWAARPGDSGWETFNVADLGTFTVTGFAENEAGELFAAGGWQVMAIIDPSGTLLVDGFESGDTAAWSTGP